MIRIAYVIPTLDQSGAERQLTLLASGLPRDRYEPMVVALNRGGYYADVLRDHDIPVHVLGKRFRFDPLTWLRLRNQLADFQPQILQSFLFAGNSYVRFPGVVPRDCRVVVSERCVDTWKSGWQKQLDRRLAGSMNVMTANSESVAAFYRDEIGIPAQRLCVIPNGLPEPAPASAERTGLRERLGLSANCRLIGFVGRLAAQKNLRDLVWAFHLLKQASTDPVALVLIGDGPERDELAEFLSDLGTRDQVFFEGHQDNAADLMHDFDVFCLPSGFEGMSNSLMEAMSRAVPSVVSDIAPNRELIQHEQNGLVFPVGDAPELGRSVLRLLNDRELANRLGQQAARRIRDQHSIADLVGRHDQLYRQLLDGQQDFSTAAVDGRKDEPACVE